MILLLFQNKNLPRFTTQQENMKTLLNEKLIFIINPVQSGRNRTSPKAP